MRMGVRGDFVHGSIVELLIGRADLEVDLHLDSHAADGRDLHDRLLEAVRARGCIIEVSGRTLRPELDEIHIKAARAVCPVVGVKR